MDILQWDVCYTFRAMDPGDLIFVTFIALGLSADCFAVALGIGTLGRKISSRNVLRVALAFGVFQMVMPLVGWLVGQTIVRIISSYDHWIAFALLTFVGVKMIWEFVHGEGGSENLDIVKWGTLLTLSLATSIDALAVGLSFAFLRTDIVIASLIIGLVAFCVTAFSFWLGRKASVVMGRWAQLIGGLILMGIGLRILLTHIG